MNNDKNKFKFVQSAKDYLHSRHGGSLTNMAKSLKLSISTISRMIDDGKTIFIEEERYTKK